VDSSGNIIVTGQSQSTSSSSSYDYATIKYSGAGVALWTNRYNGPGNNLDRAAALSVDGNNNVFVTGQSEGSGATLAYSSSGVPLWTNRCNFSPDSMAVDNGGNVFVTGRSSGNYVTIAYSGGGPVLWTNYHDGGSFSISSPPALAVDGIGNVFVTGYSASSSGFGTEDYLTIKYSGAGMPVWTNRYNGPGNYTDICAAVAVDGTGNVFVTGQSSSSSSPFSLDYATIAYSGAGIPLWTNRYNGPANAMDFANAVTVDGNGNVFVTGLAAPFSSSGDFATIAYSGAGVPLWTNRYNGPGDTSDQGNAIVTDSSGNVIVTGSASGGATTIAYTSAGLPLWTNQVAGMNSAPSKQSCAIAANGVVIAGWTVASPDYEVVKYAPVFPTGYNQIAARFLTGGDLSLSFVGNSGTYYALDRTLGLLPPVWTPQETNLTSISGLLIFTNTPIPSTNNFWRIRSVP